MRVPTAWQRRRPRLSVARSKPIVSDERKRRKTIREEHGKEKKKDQEKEVGEEELD